MSNNASFLPDDYLDQKAERRTNLISLVLFAIVLLGVFGAFLFTNQKRSVVKRDQTRINVEYQQAAEQIKELLELEKQKQEMLHKAELAAALVERVPRSVLLAELVNRMPERLSLLEFSLSSEKLKNIVHDSDDANLPAANRLQPTRAKTKEEAARETKKVRPPQYKVFIVLTGVAPSGQEVSRYLAELNDYELLQEVTLEYTEEKEIEGQIMQQFEIRMELDPAADIRDIEPRVKPRTDPMNDQMRLRANGVPSPGSTVQVGSGEVSVSGKGD